MAERQQDVLRLQPEMIPALRSEFEAAVKQLNHSLSNLRRSGYLSAPWLGDETSQQVAAHYTGRAMDEPQSSYQALIAYRDELARIHDTLQRMEDEYRRRDHDASTDLGRRA
jgi:hypothetical protein